METSTTATTLPVPSETAAVPVVVAEEREPLQLCPVQESVKIVGRKWHLIILWELSKTPLGFNELKTATRGISAKMLSQSLNDLEEHRLVVRDILSQRPLRVSYRLTEKARELSALFYLLQDWGLRHGLCDDARAEWASNSDDP